MEETNQSTLDMLIEELTSLSQLAQDEEDAGLSTLINIWIQDANRIKKSRLSKYGTTIPSEVQKNVRS